MAASYPTKNSPNPKARPQPPVKHILCCPVLALRGGLCSPPSASSDGLACGCLCGLQNNPEVCGYFGFSECAAGSKCSCRFNFFNLFCLSWGCADAAHEL